MSFLRTYYSLLAIVAITVLASSSLFAQNRDLRAERIVIDDNNGNVLILQTPSGPMTGPTYDIVIPQPGTLSADVILTNVSGGQTIQTPLQVDDDLLISGTLNLPGYSAGVLKVNGTTYDTYIGPVDLTAEVSGVLPDANVADDLTINGGAITNSTGAFTALSSTGIVNFGGATSISFPALVTFPAGSINFAAIGSGTNLGQTLTVGAGSSLALGGGSVEASEFIGTGSTSGAVDLASGEVGGVLPAANGGTGTDLSGSSNGDVFYWSGSGLTALSAGTDGDALVLSGGVPSWQDISLPSGALDNDILRWDAGSNSWVATSNVSVSSAGDLTVNGTSTLGDGDDNVTVNAGTGTFDLDATTTDIDGGTVSIDGSTSISIGGDDASNSITIGHGGGDPSTTTINGNVTFGGSVTLPLTEDNVFVGNASNEAAAVAPTATGEVLQYDGTSTAFGLITNTNVDAAAAIAGSKIDPDFGTQNVTTTGSLTGGAITGSSLTLGGTTLSAADLLDLTDGGTTTLHNHDDRYYTETELGSTANGEGASLIGIEDAAGDYTATNVEGALTEIAGSLPAPGGSTGDILYWNGTSWTPTSAISTDGTDADISGNLDVTGTITGGAIENTPIGAGTPSTGDFTNLTSNTSLSATGNSTLGDGDDNVTVNAGTGTFDLDATTTDIDGGTVSIDGSTSISIGGDDASNSITIGHGGGDPSTTTINGNVNFGGSVTLPLTEDNVFVGNASNEAAAVAPTATGQVLQYDGTSTAFGLITNTNVDAAAAIAGSKIDPDFGTQNVTTTGSLTGGAITGSSLTLGGTTLSAADLLDLTDGGTTNLHNHDDRYYTETELGSTANGKGASLIGIEDFGGDFTATNVEGALGELAADMPSSGTAAGQMLYWDGTSWTETSAGTAGQVLLSGGAGSPTWADYEALPTTGTSNSTLRYDGSDWVENTNLTSDASGNVTASGSLSAGGNVTLTNGGTASELRLNEPSGSGTNYTGLRAQAQANDHVYTLPANVGTAGQVLSISSIAGNDATLNWITPAAAVSAGTTANSTLYWDGSDWLENTNVRSYTSGNLELRNGGTSAELRIYEPSGSGSNFTAFKAAAQGANITYTLPAADGAAGEYLTTNGSGTLTWATPLDNFALIGGTVIERKGSDESVNSATLQNDDDLVISTGTFTNQTYEVEVVLIVDPPASGSNSFNVGLNIPTGSTMTVSVLGYSSKAATTAGGGVLTASATPLANNMSFNANNGDHVVYMRGVVHVNGTAGDIRVMWSTPGGWTATVSADSYMVVRRME